MKNTIETKFVELTVNGGNISGASTQSTGPCPRTPCLPEDVCQAALRGWRIFRVDVTAKYASDMAVAERIDYATSDLASLEQEYAGNRECNWAVATGPESGVFVLEIDPGYGGPAVKVAEAVIGTNSREWGWRTLAAQREDTLLAFYAYPRGRVMQDRQQLVPGVIARGTSGYALIPPSAYSYGTSHAYLDPDLAVREAPPLLLELLIGPPPKAPAAFPELTPIHRVRRVQYVERPWQQSGTQNPGPGRNRHSSFRVDCVRGKSHYSRRY